MAHSGYRELFHWLELIKVFIWFQAKHNSNADEDELENNKPNSPQTKTLNRNKRDCGSRISNGAKQGLVNIGGGAAVPGALLGVTVGTVVFPGVGSTIGAAAGTAASLALGSAIGAGLGLIDGIIQGEC